MEYPRKYDIIFLSHSICIWASPRNMHLRIPHVGSHRLPELVLRGPPNGRFKKIGLSNNLDLYLPSPLSRCEGMRAIRISSRVTSDRETETERKEAAERKHTRERDHSERRSRSIPGGRRKTDTRRSRERGTDERSTITERGTQRGNGGGAQEGETRRVQNGEHERYE